MAQNNHKHKRKSKKPISHQSTLVIHKCMDKIKNHNADSRTFFNLANELNQHGDVNGAQKYYLKGLKRNPNDNTALTNMSLILIGLSDFVQAIIYLTRAITHTPDQFTAYIYRSLAYLGAGKKFEAYLDFKFVYENYSDKIHRFTIMDKSRYPQIDFEEAMEFCLNPDTIVKPWPWPEVYFATEDCPVDEICLQKEFCLQKDVCPQNDISNFKDLINKQKCCLPGEHNVETILIDMDKVLANREPSQPVIVSEIPVKIHSSSRLQWKRRIHKLLRFYVIAKHRLNSVFYFVFFLLFLPLNDIISENVAILDM